MLPYFAQLADLHGDHALGGQARAEGAALAHAVAGQWTGHWFNRGYKRATAYGVDSLYVNAQPWAVLAGAATPTQAATLATTITRLLSAPSPIGAASQSPSQGYGPAREQPTGNATTGGVWYALNGPLVWAFAAVAPDLAYREYTANTHASYAQAYPDNWFGVLSGPDAYDSFESPRAGQAFLMDYPVQNPHAHAWQLSTTVKEAGIQPTQRGYTIDPHWPFPDFSFTSAVIGVTYAHGRVRGRLRPEASATVTMRLRLPAASAGPVAVCVDGTATPAQVRSGFADWPMHLRKGEATTWTLTTGTAPCR